jgi:magnesium-transporting ATPase (P-type)
VFGCGAVSYGVVFATGGRSLIGQIASLAGDTRSVDTTLQREIKLFVKRLSIGSVVFGLIFFAVSMARGNDWCGRTN